MMRPVKLPVIGMVRPDHLAVGAVLFLGLLCVPVVSNPLIEFITSLRAKVSSMVGGK